MTKQTKAQRIFRALYYDCQKHVQAWGYDEPTGFNRLPCRDDETVCTRTVNAVQKLWDTERNRIDNYVKFEIIDDAEYQLRLNALDMAYNTIQNQRQIIDRDKEYFSDMRKMSWEDFCAKWDI